jgi:hypothetical protein
MSHTFTAAPSKSAINSLLASVGAQLSGKMRGPDQGQDRRVPRRNSYEVSDPRANRWTKIGDGSFLQGKVHCETLIDTANDLRLQLHEEFPLAEIRRRRAERADAAAELEQLLAGSPAEVPAGRPAQLRMAIAKHEEWLEKADNRLTRTDVDVLRGLLSFLDFATGRLFPSIKAIAARVGCHYNTANESLGRLRSHGLIDRVRRTIRTGNDGQAGPQLEQTSNAYFFDHRRRMAARTWKHYWNKLCVALRRLGARKPPAPVLSIVGAAPAPLTPLQAALASLGSTVAEREHTE